MLPNLIIKDIYLIYFLVIILRKRYIYIDINEMNFPLVNHSPFLFADVIANYINENTMLSSLG